MDVKQLHEYAQNFVGLKPDFDAPVFSPQQLHPEGHRTQMDEKFFHELGIACFHFLNTRKKFKHRASRPVSAKEERDETKMS